MRESNLYLTEKDINSHGVTLDKVIEDLTLPNPEYENFIRFGRGRFYKKIEKTICYLQQNDKEYILPRYYFGEPDKLTWVGKPLSSTKFVRELRDYQSEFLTGANAPIIKSHTGLLFEASCGSGKTVIAIYHALQIGVKTLVVVPTYYLANQWKERIKEFTDCSCIVVTAQDKEIPTDSDFTIAVMDTFTVRVLPKELISSIGHVILDEAHRVGADTYLPILNEIPAKYRTALTATFRRSDGVHKILKYHFGEHLKMDSRFPPAKVYTIPTNIKVEGVVRRKELLPVVVDYLEDMGSSISNTENFSAFRVPRNFEDDLSGRVSRREITKSDYGKIGRVLRRAQKLQYSTVESYLSENSRRRKLLIKVVEAALKEGRTVLYLSKRKSTLKSLHKVFEKYRPMLIISETNSMGEKDKKYLQEECQLILGIMQLAKEGLDIDRLDTLIFDLPLKDTEQAIGRILRYHPDKKSPLCLYPLDDCALSYAVFTNAKKFIRVNAEYIGNIYLSGVRNLQTILEK